MNHEPPPAPRLRLRALQPSDTRLIHETALNILARVGIAVGDRDTGDRLKALGCRETADGRLLFDAMVVQTALNTVPRRLVLYDRNGRRALDTAEETPRFCPGVNCINVLDYRNGRVRPCTLADIADAARVCDRLEHLDMAANLGNPCELPPEEQAIAGLRTLMTHTAKPFPFIAHDENEAERIWNYLAGVAGGWDQLASRPFAVDLTGPTSPLAIKAEACRRLRFAAARRLPLVCYPALFPGVTGPMTLAGALSQSAAEVLAGIVIHQAEGPGAPLASGSALLPMDMRTVNISYGGPEYALAGMAAVDYFSDIGVPSWIGAGCSDAHGFDAQAVAEAGANITSAALSHTAWIHNLGFLCAGRTGSLEMLVACDELAGMARRFVTGVAVSPETLAEPVIARAGASGRYLHHPHTRKHARRSMWIPSVFTRLDSGAWGRSGATSARKAIRQRIAQILAA